METIYLPQHHPTTFKSTVDDGKISPISITKNPFSDNGHMSVISSAQTQKPHFFRTIVDVVGEGLKQNFLGPNIDMEFLTLSLRSFASTSAIAIQQFVKPLMKKQEVELPCHQLNQPCF